MPINLFGYQMFCDLKELLNLKQHLIVFIKLPVPFTVHPSIQWRYSPNRALASSIEVP
jgi:hypothetical protein